MTLLKFQIWQDILSLKFDPSLVSLCLCVCLYVLLDVYIIFTYLLKFVHARCLDNTACS